MQHFFLSLAKPESPKIINPAFLSVFFTKIKSTKLQNCTKVLENVIDFSSAKP